MKRVPLPFCFSAAFVLAVHGPLCASPRPEREQWRGVTIITENDEPLELYSNSYALLVGNSGYQHWDRLKWPTRDVDEIADVLHISEATVRTHVSNILSKLNLSNRTQAALYALREGLASVNDVKD